MDLLAERIGPSPEQQPEGRDDSMSEERLGCCFIAHQSSANFPVVSHGSSCTKLTCCSRPVLFPWGTWLIPELGSNSQPRKIEGKRNQRQSQERDRLLPATRFQGFVQRVGRTHVVSIAWRCRSPSRTCSLCCRRHRCGVQPFCFFVRSHHGCHFKSHFSCFVTHWQLTTTTAVGADQQKLRSLPLRCSGHPQANCDASYSFLAPAVHSRHGFGER